MPSAILQFKTKATRTLRRMIRRQRREALQRRADRKARRVALKLQNKLNRNQARVARPKAGCLKDRENSDPSDGEDEGLIVTSSTVAITTTVVTTTTVTVVNLKPTTPHKPTAANRPVRACRRGRESLADVEHSAGSDDEDNVLPNFQARLTDAEVVELLMSMSRRV